jgi:hypothetical protein
MFNMSASFSLQSRYDLPAQPQSHSIETDEGISIEVASACIGQSARVCRDLFEVASKSAHPVPALQVAISREVNFANYAGQPLVCRLNLDLL